jgi:hypothetical protein
MIPPSDEIPGEQPRHIYSRLLGAVTAARVRRNTLGALAAESQPAIYLGEEEWFDLSALLAKWGVEWRGSGASYDPATIEANRAEFHEVKIYRVDAKQHLTAV